MKEFARFTLRIDRNLFHKLEYIAKYEFRTKNKEIEQIIKRYIADFEAEHGKIDV